MYNIILYLIKVGLHLILLFALNFLFIFVSLILKNYLAFSYALFNFCLIIIIYNSGIYYGKQEDKYIKIIKDQANQLNNICGKF